MDGQAMFFRPGGTLDPSAASYIVRKADQQLLDALLEGEYVFVLDSRQKGKSSLIARTLLRLKENGVRTVKLDLQRIGANVSPEQWYAGLLVGIGQELGLQKELLEYWEAHQAVGPLARWVNAIKDVVLAKVFEPIVIFVDEIDFVRALNFPTDEFFAAIRDCYNRRTEPGGFIRLTFCLVGVATPGQLIRNPDISPFNIGRRIELTDFSLDETTNFAQALQAVGRDGVRLMERVHHWVEGHPYLTQLLCSRVAGNPQIDTTQAVDKLVREILLSPEARQREPNLADVERRLLDPDVPGLEPDERRSQVLDLYGRMLKSNNVDATEQNPVVATLRLSGIGMEDTGFLRVRNRVYRTVFDNNWRVHNLPEAEVRRQATATKRATLRTAAVAGIVILAVSAAAVEMFNISRERQQALLTLGRRTDDLNRVSTDRQQALSALEQRNQELKRTANEKQAALNSLGQRNQELTRVSTERQHALSTLQVRTEDLKRVSSEREHTLKSLSQRTDELRQKNYVGLMASIRLAIQERRWTRVAELIDQSKTDPLRGWEWGYVANLMSGHVAETQLSTNLRSQFEQDPDGSLSLLTPEAIYKVTASGLQLRRKFKGPSILPLARKGDLRLGVDAATGIFVLRNADTDEIVMQTDQSVRSFDPKSQTIDVQLGGGSLEKRSFDGKIVAKLGRYDSLRACSTKLLNGDELTLFSDGRILRTDSLGKKTAESKVLPPLRIGSQELVCSKDEALITHVDWGISRPIQVRRSIDLSIVVTLDAPLAVGGTVAFAPDNSSILVGTLGVITRYDLRDGRALQSYYGHKSLVQQLAFLPGSRHFASRDRNGVLRIWPLEPSPVVKELGTFAVPPNDLWLCDEPRVLLYPTADEAIESRNLQTGETTRLPKPAGGGSQEPFSVVSGSKVFTGTASGRLDRLNAYGLKKEKSVQVFDKLIYGMSVLMGGRKLLVRSNIGKPHPGENYPPHTTAQYAIVDAKTLKVQHRFSPDWPLPGVNYLGSAVSDGPIFAVSANKWWKGPLMPSMGVIRLVSAESGKIFRKLEFDGETIDAVALSPTGSRLFVAFYTGLAEASSRIAVFDTSTGKQVGSMQSPEGVAIRGFYRKGDLLLGELADDNIAIWNLAKGSQCKVLSPGQRIMFYDIAPDRDRILTALADGSVMFWDAKTGEELLSLPAYPPKDAIQSISRWTQAVFSKDGTKILMYGSDGVLRVLNSKPWKDQPSNALKKAP